MSSIDLVQLRAQALDLAGELHDPPSFRKRLRRLMQTHAHYSLRRGRSMVRRSAIPAWEVSGILLRELETAVKPILNASPELAEAAADAIWEDGWLEERQFAARLYSFIQSDSVLRSIVNRRVEATEDPLLLEELSGQTCATLRGIHPALFRADLRRWLESPRAHIRRFGWYAIQAWYRESRPEGGLAALELLPMAFPDQDFESRQIAIGLMKQIAENAPAEFKKWMEDLPTTYLNNSISFFRAAILELPEPFSAELRARVSDL